MDQTDSKILATLQAQGRISNQQLADVVGVSTVDIASFDAFLEDFLFGLEGISQVRSNIALRELKFDTSLPIPATAR